MHVWISLSLLFWHKVLTSNFKRSGQRNNIQLLSAVYTIERWLVVPVSTGRTMRQSSRMMCHTPPDWLVMPCSYPSTLLFFLSVPLYSIEKWIWSVIKSLTHSQQHVQGMQQPLISKKKRQKKNKKCGAFLYLAVTCQDLYLQVSIAEAMLAKQTGGFCIFKRFFNTALFLGPSNAWTKELSKDDEL